MIRVRQIKVPIDDDNIKTYICKKLKITKDEILKIKINKKSIDARKKDNIHYVYEVDVKLKDELKILKYKNTDIFKTPVENYVFKISGTTPLNKRPVIIGSGPAGLFCAYLLAENGYKPIIIERGEKIEDRVKTVSNFWDKGVLNTESNVQFGEGGAGTFSDGKLNTLVKDKSFRMKKVFETFVKMGAPEEILYINKPHIGTDLLRNVIINMRKAIISMGGEFKYNTKMEDIIINNDKVKEIITSNEHILCDTLVLAIGHSSRDTFKMLYDKKLNMEAKPFAVGIRLQHPQKLINENQYGNIDLPPASYKLTYKAKNGRGVYSFCMCPGGYVVNASSEKGRIAINGMSNHDRNSGIANTAIVVTISPDDFGTNPLDGIKFQRTLEEKAYEIGKGNIPIQLYKDYKNNIISNNQTINAAFKGKYSFANINEIFPKCINDSIKEAMEDFNKKIKGFNNDKTVLAASESRTSSPLRILRNDNLESNIKGIYPCGEGAGYAGGITSAAMDGIKVAEAIAKLYKPF